MYRVDSVVKNSLLQPRPYQRRIVAKAVAMIRGEFIQFGGEQESFQR